jgi:PiT family inorganic phosphate transporter
LTALLVAVAVGFAFSIGAHYTGACMGMPHALGAVSSRAALLLMAPLALIGATFASEGVEHTVAHSLLAGASLSVSGFVIVVGIAFALTSAFNGLRIPTSTIQILVFTVVGTALATGVGVRWATIGTLAVIWVCAPVAAVALGFLLTRLLDRVIPDRPARPEPHTPPADGAGPAEGTTVTTGRRGPGRLLGSAVFRSGGWLGISLVAVGMLASFTMGGNDVANATGALVATRTFSPVVAGLVGGVAIAAGVLTWGQPLLRRVAFDIVTVDRQMATAAQLVQAAVVLGAVGFGFFTSMNQALVGAMGGAGLARGRHTVHVATLLGIVRGWVVGAGAGLGIAYGVTRLVVVATGSHALVGMI